MNAVEEFGVVCSEGSWLNKLPGDVLGHVMAYSLRGSEARQQYAVGADVYRRFSGLFLPGAEISKGNGVVAGPVTSMLFALTVEELEGLIRYIELEGLRFRGLSSGRTMRLLYNTLALQTEVFVLERPLRRRRYE